MTVGHRCHEGRIAQIPRTDGGQHGVLLFHKALGLGQDNEVPLVTQALEEADGDGVGHAAVQQGVVADPDGLRRQRHGRRGLHPAHVFGVAAAALVVDRVAGVQVGADDKEVHGRSAEGLFIEGVQLFRHLVVAEILAVEVAGAQQIAEAGVALVVAIFGVVADDAADLVRLEVAAEHRARRHADGAIGGEAVLHQDIQNACGEHPPHGTAL